MIQTISLVCKMSTNRRNSKRGQSPPNEQGSNNVQIIEFPIWLESVHSSLAEVEQRYDLKNGEMLLASNTSPQDLAELHSYGWTAAETCDSIVDRAGLR